MSAVAQRRCAHCAKPLPDDARMNRRYCDASCRTGAYERRQRRGRVALLTEQTPPTEGPTLDAPAAQLDRIRAAVTDALQEPKLVAVIAAAARGGDWRAASWLLSRLHPTRWGERGRDVPLAFDNDPDDPFAEVDQLAARRRRTMRQPE